jgi:uncharacterized protein (TIGR03086 family)
MVIDLFTEGVEAVQLHQWNAPTPCDGWDVRTLVEHAVDYQRGYGAALGADQAVHTALGEDPAGSWSAIRSALIDIYGAPGILERSFDFLPIPGTVADQLIVPTADLLIHTWDLARAIGISDALPTDVCEGVLSAMRTLEESIRIPEWYGPAIEPPPGSDAQTLLLCFAGRQV